MKVLHLQGNTYAIETDLASVGLYVLEDRSCLLIDSGASSRQGQQILNGLNEQGWTICAIINTHSHADHTGGNRCLQENTGCPIYASAIEAALIEHPLLTPYTLYGGFPPKVLQGKFFMPQPSRVTECVAAGKWLFKEKEFDILDLAGHTLGHIGIRTPDDIVFAGDSLIAPEILEENPFLYLADPARQFATLEKFSAMAWPWVYLAHGGWQDDVSAVIEANHAMMVHILDALIDIVRQPHSLEDVTSAIMDRQGLEINRNHYFRLTGSVASFLAYLCNQGQVQLFTEKTRLLYRSKQMG